MSSASAVLQLPIRLDDGTGKYFDLMIELAADAQIGELADHLAEQSGACTGQTILNSAGSERQSAVTYQRFEQVSLCGPRAGETIRLVPVPTAIAADPDRTPNSGGLAPVFLHSSSKTEPTLQLCYGLSHVYGAEIEVTERVEVRATGAGTPLVNGAPILGSSRLGSGDFLNINSQLCLVRISGPLRPPPEAGPTQRHKITVSRSSSHVAQNVPLPSPPATQRLPGFPLLSAIVPLLMGTALWIATKSLASALFVLFSFVFVVASGIEARRESRAEQKFRLAEFHAGVDEALSSISQLHQEEFDRLDQQVPPAHRLAKILADRTEQLWCRSLNDAQSGPMVVRLGTALITPQDQMRVQAQAQGPAELKEQLRQLAETFELAELPSIVDLDQIGGLGIVGRDELATALARSLLLQLAIALPPEELQICVLARQDRLDVWRWCAWLPHCRTQSGSLRTLLVVDGADDDLVSAASQQHGAAKTRMIWLSALRAGLPAGLGAIVELGKTQRLILDALARDDPSLRNSGEKRVLNLTIEDLTEDEAIPLARGLAPLVKEQSSVAIAQRTELQGDSQVQPRLPTSHLPMKVSLHEVLADLHMLHDPDAVLAQWARSAASSSLAAPLGRVAHGVLHLDLRADGPHALIAGTTGSGKSELLRSFVASLALHHSADRLTFLLVDYKGGAAFSSLTLLPHTVGLITDLSPQLAMRALVSLRAELRYREEQFAKLGISEITEVPKNGSVEVPPALVVVVDEFATLARELPDFVDGLVDLSQRGRSLGMHLVLATQRPAGVITDAIRANTGLRIALRVADEDDSRDVVELPEAALLPRDVPGRAILRSGPGQCAAVQFAYSGSSRQAEIRARSWPLGDPAPKGVVDVARSSLTDLDAAVASVVAAAAKGQLRSPRPPWLDALPELLALSQIQPRGKPLAIGWSDRPDLQRRELLRVNLLRDGGLLLLGASGSGRSTTLCTTALAAINQFGGHVQIFGIDAGSGLSQLREFSQVGAIISVEDSERVLRLLRRLAAELQLRSQPRSNGSNHSPQLLLVDGFSAFEELYERINRAEAIDLLAKITREGRSLGLHVLVAACRRAEVPPRISAMLGCQIYLRSSTADDALMLGLDPESAQKETPPGRGFQHGHQVQVAQPDHLSRQLGLNQPGLAPTIGSLPRSLRFSELLVPDASHLAQPSKAKHNVSTSWTPLPCGIGAEQLDLAMLDLAHQHGLIAGPPRSGKSTALNTLALALSASTFAPARSASYLLAAHDCEAHDSIRWTSTLTGAQSARDAAEFLRGAALSARSGVRTLVAVDDVCRLLELPEGEQVETAMSDLIELGRTHQLRLVLSAEIDMLLRSYSEVIIQLRSSRTGILLGIDPDLHGEVLHTSLPLRSELTNCSGRGWLVSPFGAEAVQIAHP